MWNEYKKLNKVNVCIFIAYANIFEKIFVEQN